MEEKEKKEEKNEFVEWLQRQFAEEAKKTAKDLYRMGAIVGAATTLAEAEKITDPIEQVKYLHLHFLHHGLHMMWIPWAWLTHCVEKKLISKLPNEDWAIAVCIGGSHLEGNPALALQFIDMK